MYLRELLSSLMGSPVGLKLNKAFNTMLGKCFLYHIELWWIFLGNLFAIHYLRLITIFNIVFNFFYSSIVSMDLS